MNLVKCIHFWKYNIAKISIIENSHEPISMKEWNIKVLRNDSKALFFQNPQSRELYSWVAIVFLKAQLIDDLHKLFQKVFAIYEKNKSFLI